MSADGEGRHNSEIGGAEQNYSAGPDDEQPAAMRPLLDIIGDHICKKF